MENIEEEDDLFDQIIQQRKVTQSQAQRIQQSQHSHNENAKYSAPSSQIYQYQSGNMINNNKSNVSNLPGLSNLPKKGKFQYYTVEQLQQLDP